MRGLPSNLAALFGTETGGSLRATFGAPLSEGGGLGRVGGLVFVSGDLASGRLDDELREGVGVARALGMLGHLHSGNTRLRQRQGAMRHRASAQGVAGFFGSAATGM